jgi:hypothetical protein
MSWKRMRRRLGVPFAVTLACFGGISLALVSTVPARAEHFDILLRLRSAQGVAESGWDTAPPEGGVKQRERVRAAAGEEVTLEWQLRSEFPHGIMKDVTIRIFVAPIARAGQKELPAVDGPRVIDNSFTADFLPHHSARGHVRFRVIEPGDYLVRLQSEDTQTGHGHEHFGAVDLQVK